VKMERTPRPEKVAVVDEVRERFTNSTAVLLTEYRGIDVAAMSTLRRSLREAGGEYKIYKNTLVRLAVADLGVDGLTELMIGPTALAFVEGDAAAVAKALKDFKGTNENLVIKGAVLGSELLTESQVMVLAALPSRDQLLAKFAGGLQAPMSQFAALLQASISKFAYALQALIESGGGPDAPAAIEAPAPEPEPEAVPVTDAAEEAPVEEAEEAPAEEAVAADAAPEAADEAPAEETPAEETPAEDVPAAAVEEAPADEEDSKEEG
jgi:large subunit ribosomal protein L10